MECRLISRYKIHGHYIILKMIEKCCNPQNETGNPAGVVRYIQMLTEGMKHMNGIKVHIICLQIPV